MQKTLTGESVISGLIEAYNRKDQEEIVKIAFGLVEHEDNGARKEIIDVLGKDIGSIKDGYGRSLAHDMVKYGNDEVRKKIIDALLSHTSMYNCLKLVKIDHRLDWLKA